MRMLRNAAAAAALLLAPVVVAAGNAGPPQHAHRSGQAEADAAVDLLGKPAPAWSFTRWIGAPRTLESLRGKVVLLRWWTEGCHYCATTLPELEALRKAHAGEGLVVIGVYHPKPQREVSDKTIAAAAKRLGFQGLLAVDRDWATFERYWLSHDPQGSWTSVSFLIDRAGAIRWVHGGGEYHRSDDPAHARCAAQYAELERTLARVLAEPVPSGLP